MRVNRVSPPVLQLLLVASLASPLSAQIGAGVIINEVHYNPPDETKLEEFIELYNAGEADVDISGWYFSDGVSFTFPRGTTIPRDGYLVVAESPPDLAKRFPAVAALGPFEGHLSNNGE